MNVVFGDVVLGVHGKGFDYLFSYQEGGPVSFVVGGMEWLYRAPKPTFWRATTCNDRGNHFPERSSMWMGADLFIGTKQVEVFADGEPVEGFLAPDNNRLVDSPLRHPRTVEARYTYATCTTPSTDVVVGYLVRSNGTIEVSVSYQGKRGLPELPVFGIRFIMPTVADGFTYQGLSGETYPDRMAGGVRGTYHVDSLPVTPYLVPQECGMHMETDRLQVFRTIDGKRAALEFRKHGLRFAFSALPYTALELESATHQEELPPARRTVLCLLGAVRGVGGINSWGADVEPQYHIPSDKDISYSFLITPSSLS